MKKVLLLSFFAVSATVALAVPVSEPQVGSAARAWAARDGRLGARLNRAGVERVASLATSNGAPFYAVKMAGGGTIFMSADTEEPPVLAFSGGEEDLTSPDPKGPLWAMLNNDVSVRHAARGAVTPSLRTAVASAPAEGTCEAEWAALFAEAAKPPFKTGAVAPDSYTSIGDIRVAPLLKTKWAQDTSKGQACWNYYTPNGSNPVAFKPGDAGNAVCGCVATALSQVLYYFRYPFAPVQAKTLTCAWGESYKKFDLTMQGGTYDWDAMPVDPDKNGSTEAQRQAVGKLTSDAGIAVHMNYHNDALGQSGAYSFDLPTALTDVFGYAGAVWFRPERDFFLDEGKATKAYQRVMYANFDAGLPVLLGLTGHQVVGDGYGFVDGNDYVHVNMGWASAETDIWYLMPYTKYSSFGMPMSVQDVCYNVLTNAPAGSAALSGRVTDEDGNAVAGATVRLFAAGTADLVTELVTSDRGIWGAVVPAGTYDVSVEKDGLSGVAENAVVAAPTVTRTTQRGVDDRGNVVRINDNVPLVSSTGNAGNSWGNDVTISAPRALVYDGDAEIARCASLDRAILLASAVSGARIVIAEPITLRKSMTVSSDCRIESAVGVAAITCANGATLTVAAGATLELADVAFAGAGGTVVTVAAGGCLSLAGSVDFGIADAETAAVKTAAADGLVFAAPIAYGFTLDCAAAAAVGSAFATVACDAAAFGESGALVANKADLEIRGVLDAATMQLAWQAVPCPLDQAAGYYVDAEGQKQCFARFDRVLDQFELALAEGTLAETPEIVLCKSATLSRGLTVGADLTLRAAEGLDPAPELTFVSPAPAGFAVSAGTLSVNGVVFRGYTGPGLFTVNGGALELQSCAFVDITGTAVHSGAVAVERGTVEAIDCSFDNCRLEDGKTQRSGGALTLVGAGASARLEDVTIENCRAAYYGGGVYVGAGATLALAGEGTKVVGNASGNYPADDIYLATAMSRLEVSAPLGGTRQIGVRAGVRDLMNAGGAFAFPTVTFNEAELFDSAQAFFRDGNDDLYVEGQATQFVWTLEEPDPRTDDPTLAVLRVSGLGDDFDGLYRSLDDALAWLADATAAATVTLLADCELTEGALIHAPRTIVSDTATGPFTVTRTAEAVLTIADDGSLTLEDVCFDGGKSADVFGLLIRVEGGEVTLKDGTVITGVSGSRKRVESAIWVGNGGTITLEAGSQIVDCNNDLESPSDGAGYGGGLTVDNSTAYFRGGTVTRCHAYRYGGGIFVGNRSTVYVSGDLSVLDNLNLDGKPSNLTVADQSQLFVDGVLTGGNAQKIGIYTGFSADKYVFGEITDEFGAGLGRTAYITALTNSAARFSNDQTKAYGVAVTNAGDRTLLVWSRGIARDGSFAAADGAVYQVVGDIPINEIDVFPDPISFSAIVYDREQGTCTLTLTNLVRGCWYSLYRTDTLENGFPIAAPVAPVTRFQAEADGPWTYEHTLGEGEQRLFWRATAEPGVVFPE